MADLQTLAATLSGPDRPGITHALMSAVAGLGTEVLDLEQVVVRGQVTIALLLGSLALMVHFWDTPLRVTVAWSVAGGWLALSLALAGLLALLVRRAPAAFAITREELAKDWSLIKESM